MKEEQLNREEIDRLIYLVKQEIEFITKSTQELSPEEMGKLIIQGLKSGEESLEIKELIHSNPETEKMYAQLKLLQAVAPNRFKKAVIRSVKSMDKKELINTTLLVQIHDKLHLLKSL